NENGDAFDAENDVKSTVDVRALTLQEIGFSFAREVNMGGMNFAAGITPKYVKATVYDYEAKATDEDADDNEDDYSKEYSHFNLDLGVAKNYANGWRTGFVIKNLIAQEYDTYRRNSNTGEMEKTGNRIELKPQARIGVSHTSDWHTVALDVDLTENEPVGFEEGSRFVALGGELNLADWAQLRAGYRVNTVDSDRSIASVGLGLSPFGVHFDVAVAGNDNEMGAAAQFGFRF
ncbi:MAG: conjugal transfer protein TraF, partial [Pseudomonadota bacterium]